DDRVVRVVGAAGDLALQRLAERALEVPQALRPHARDRRELAADRAQDARAARRDVRQLELLAEDLRELLERDVDLEHVLALLLAGLAVLRLAVERLAVVALALADAAALVLAEAELRQLDLRQRDRHVALALLADQLAGRDVLLQVLLDAPAHDVAEA